MATHPAAIWVVLFATQALLGVQFYQQRRNAEYIVNLQERVISNMQRLDRIDWKLRAINSREP